MRRLKRTFAGFLLGILFGAIIGALGGTMDRGSMFILVPSGPPFWAIIGAMVGSIVGAFIGAISLSFSRKNPSLRSEKSDENGEEHKVQGRLDGTE